MAKKLLTEFFELCKDGICQDLLTEREKRESANGVVYLSGRLQTCEKKNGNGRIYPCKTLKREIKNYQKIIADNMGMEPHKYDQHQELGHTMPVRESRKRRRRKKNG